MKDRLDRDEMFYRLAHYKTRFEKSEDLIRDLKRAPDPNFQDRQGTSYLHIACQEHYMDAIATLLAMGADPNINDKRGFSPVLSALGRINESNPAILEMMLNYGLDLSKREGNSTLIEILRSFREDEINRIIDRYYQQGVNDHGTGDGSPSHEESSK